MRSKRCAICEKALTPHQAASGYLCDSLSCKFKVGMNPSLRRCECCGQVLKGMELRSAICSNPSCVSDVHETQMAEQLRERSARAAAWQQSLRMQTESYRAACGEQAGVPNAESYMLVIVPHHHETESALPEARREEFRMHVTEVATIAYALRHDAPEDTSGRLWRSWSIPVSDETNAIAMQACISCRGSCCSNGGNQAYLTKDTMRAYFANHPDHGVDDAVATYMSHVGTHTFTSRCVYQREHGCSLTRDLRSTTCNNFFCDGLRNFFHETDKNTSGSAFVVATDQDILERGIFTSGEFVQLVHRSQILKQLA